MSHAKISKLASTLLAVTLAAASGSAGCGGDKESLVVVAMTANPPAPQLTSVRITVGTVPRTFALMGGLTATPSQRGVYIPASSTGQLRVTVVASGGSCDYEGDTTVTIASAGERKEVAVLLEPSTACGTDGGGGSGGSGGVGGTGGFGDGSPDAADAGMGGSGGTAGTGGTGGTDGPPPDAGMEAGPPDARDGPPVLVAPPSLTQCIEYDHNSANHLPCNTTTGVGTWAIRSVAFSPDGNFVLSAGEDGRVKVWRVQGKTLVFENRVLATNQQAYIAFSPDGQTFAAGSRGGSLEVWNVSNWATRGQLAGVTGDIYGIAFTPDSQQLVTIDSDRKLYRHTVSTMAALPVITMTNLPYAVAVSPVATATELWAAVGFSNGQAALYNIKIAAASSPTMFPVAPAGGAVGAVRFSPDGKLLAAGTSGDSSLRFFGIPLTSMTPIDPPIVTGTADRPVDVADISFSPSGRHVALASGGFAAGGHATIWEVTTRGSSGKFVPTWIATSVAFSPSGSALAVGEFNCGQVALCAD
jgi:hypothetical protein